LLTLAAEAQLTAGQRNPTAVKGRLLEASEKVLYWHTIPLTRTLTPSWELNTR
jgi:hypothetical protein